MLAQFCRKWTETCADGRKMRFERTKNFDIEKSLENWDEYSSYKELKYNNDNQSRRGEEIF